MNRILLILFLFLIPALQAHASGRYESLLRYRSGLENILAFADHHDEIFTDARKAEARVFTHEEKEELWQLWQSALDYMVALDGISNDALERIRRKSVPSTDDLIIGSAAYIFQYKFILRFASMVDKDPALRILFDEPVRELGLTRDWYSKLKARFLSVDAATKFSIYQAFLAFAKSKAHAETVAAINSDSEYIWSMGAGKAQVLSFLNALHLLKKAGSSVFFPVQSGVAEWMGDTRVHRIDQALITPQQIQQLQRKLQPGDILFERREWYVSNIGLPGFWPHIALYVGTPEERLKFFSDESTLQWLQKQDASDIEAYLKKENPGEYQMSLGSENHHPVRVLEAISEGVTFTSLEHSAAADSLAVLRPRLSRIEIAQGLKRAFHFAGRPYDYDFDFLTDNSLVCSELVYKAFQPASDYRGLIFPLVEIAGRKATPPNEIVRMFDAAYGSESLQLELITFLDGYESRKAALLSDVKAFRSSWKRPKWHIFTQ